MAASLTNFSGKRAFAKKYLKQSLENGGLWLAVFVVGLVR
jgi:hypothetical protein